MVMIVLILMLPIVMLVTVKVSRVPPRPLAGQRLEVAGQQLRVGELLEATWGLKNLFWRAL